MSTTLLVQSIDTFGRPEVRQFASVLTKTYLRPWKRSVKWVILEDGQIVDYRNPVFSCEEEKEDRWAKLFAEYAS